MEGPKGKHIFGIVRVGERGQIVIPSEARKLFNIKAGDSLLILGDEGQGLAIMTSENFKKLPIDIAGIFGDAEEENEI